MGEGHGLITVHGDLDLCKKVCASYDGCDSLAFCSGACYLKDGDVSANSPSHANQYCTTHFLGAEPATASTTTPEPEAVEEVDCYPVLAALQMNEAQQYEGNVEG